VGLHCSPHLSDICERVVINGQPVARELFVKASEAVRTAADSISIQPSFFEAVVACVFYLAREENFDWLVLETGLGGRLDATNLVLRPELSIITNIGFDHMGVLGETLTKIALEKAGIIKEGSQVLLGDILPEAKSAILDYAGQLVTAEKTFKWADDFNLGKEKSVLPGGREVSSDVFFENSYSKSNSHNKFLAAAAAEILGFGDSIEAGLRAARWPGRFEIFEINNRRIVVDVAHNPDGISALIEAIDNYLSQSNWKPKQVGLLVSMLGRKDWKPMLDHPVIHIP
jgi:dihydrofolate synthase/folylpolyglutamate synthase